MARNEALDGPVPLLRGCDAAYLDLGSNRGLKIEQLLEARSLTPALSVDYSLHPRFPYTRVHSTHHSPSQGHAGGFLRLFPPAHRGGGALCAVHSAWHVTECSACMHGACMVNCTVLSSVLYLVLHSTSWCRSAHRTGPSAPGQALCAWRRAEPLARGAPAHRRGLAARQGPEGDLTSPSG